MRGGVYGCGNGGVLGLFYEEHAPAPPQNMTNIFSWIDCFNWIIRREIACLFNKYFVLPYSMFCIIRTRYRWIMLLNIFFPAWIGQLCTRFEWDFIWLYLNFFCILLLLILCIEIKYVFFCASMKWVNFKNAIPT